MRALASLAPHLRRRLENALDSGLLPAGASATSIRSVLGVREGVDELHAALAELEQMGVSGRAAASWLRTVDLVATPPPMPDMVWSGPEVRGLHARNTKAVYAELLTSAKRSLWVSTFVYFDGARVFADLARHMDATPGLKVTLLLNVQRGRRDTTAQDSLARRFASRFWESDWPGSARPSVYYDPRSLEPDGPAGVLHAKAVVADGEAVLVTSANLTDAALTRNIELGILARHRALAESVSRHFQGLIDNGFLAPLPRA